MNSVELFIEYFKDSFNENEGSFSDKEIRNDFFIDFTKYTPVVLQELKKYLESGNLALFYSRLNDLKYLCLFSDELNKNWFRLRALSGALSKLLAKHTVENADVVYTYYLKKYGDRHVIKEDNWFEGLRWQFLEDLKKVNSETQLSEFINAKLSITENVLEQYQENLCQFINQIKSEFSNK